jgi:16S rRNA (guanine966-N2)-methyltransferase
MRIISGQHKGRRITAPRQLPVRPTTDMAKEALFNILQHSFYFEEVSILDLYAGTGNISYEFASRGCPEILAVDAHPGCVRFIDETAKQLNLPVRAVRRDAMDFLEHHSTPFDIIFADPPYDQPGTDFLQLHELVFSKGLLKQGGLLVIEHSGHTDLSSLPCFVQARKYGGSRFSLFSPEE